MHTVAFACQDIPPSPHDDPEIGYRISRSDHTLESRCVTKKREIRALTRKLREYTDQMFTHRTSELSPIEPQWIGCKNWVNSTPLKKLVQLGNRLQTAINQGIIKIVKIYDYTLHDFFGMPAAVWPDLTIM